MRSSRKPRKSASKDIHPSLAPFRQKERGERLQKVLADAGVAARRECEKLILEGAVTVNGKTIDTLPAWSDPKIDQIEVYGKPLRPAEQHVYIVLFKPRGTVCTNSDPEGRPRAIDLVNHPSRARLYCVGRLDLDASGLLILTNDGEFANRLTHPRYEVPKGYDITLDGTLDTAAIAAIERKVFAATRGAKQELRSSMRLISSDATKSIVHMELCEHRNLQLKDLMLGLGYPVKKLRRTSFGPLKLKGLAVGEWRELSSREVEMLRRTSRGEQTVATRPAPKPAARKPTTRAHKTTMPAPQAVVAKPFKPATREERMERRANKPAAPRSAAPTSSAPRPTPRGTAAAPRGTAGASRGTAAASRGTAAASRGTAGASRGSASTPRGAAPSQRRDDSRRPAPRGKRR